uniref:AlNc14C527G12050 protein n=1 Tax=Albugo laibachii Nc14 TaxID=890382 RepID=F0X0W0_9STRA|nr:AlNc14C527G12050 [Albugo laibachii Nc14]|eukprot:CCA27405.1 AlNc14C527G12050 [Albugo laibachii Nc14]
MHLQLPNDDGPTVQALYQQIAETDEPLTLNDFDSHWLLDNFTPASAAEELTSNVRFQDSVPQLLQVSDTAPVHQQMDTRAQIAQNNPYRPDEAKRDTTQSIK